MCSLELAFNPSLTVLFVCMACQSNELWYLSRNLTPVHETDASAAPVPRLFVSPSCLVSTDPRGTRQHAVQGSACTCPCSTPLPLSRARMCVVVQKRERKKKIREPEQSIKDREREINWLGWEREARVRGVEKKRGEANGLTNVQRKGAEALKD